MRKIDDGGPAFPVVETRHGKSEGAPDWFRVFSAGGATLRDYFAAAELTKKDGVGVCDRPEVYARIADHCYRMADAMLKAREAKP